jgi:hypothetical protein
VRCAAALPDAPAWLVRAAIDLWRTRQPAPGARGAAPLRRLAAMLRFDSWAAPAVATGMRSLPSDVRHLLYATTGHDVDLRIAPIDGRFALAGQVLGPDEAAGSLELARRADVCAGDPPAPVVAELDDLGEFRLDGVSPGTYRLTLRMGGDEIVLPPIDVGGQRDRGAS